MSDKTAWLVLEKNNLTTPALIETTRQLHEKQSTYSTGIIIKSG
jgi:hypothetical protein